MKEAAELMCVNGGFSSATYPIPHLDLHRRDMPRVHERLGDCCGLRTEADADRSIRERAAGAKLGTGTLLASYKPVRSALRGWKGTTQFEMPILADTLHNCFEGNAHTLFEVVQARLTKEQHHEVRERLQLFATSGLRVTCDWEAVTKRSVRGEDKRWLALLLPFLLTRVSDSPTSSFIINRDLVPVAVRYARWMCARDQREVVAGESRDNLRDLRKAWQRLALDFREWLTKPKFVLAALFEEAIDRMGPCSAYSTAHGEASNQAYKANARKTNDKPGWRDHHIDRRAAYVKALEKIEQLDGRREQTGAKESGSLQRARNVLRPTVAGGCIWNGTASTLACSWDVVLRCGRRRWCLQASKHLRSLQHLFPALRVGMARER